MYIAGGRAPYCSQLGKHHEAPISIMQNVLSNNMRLAFHLSGLVRPPAPSTCHGNDSLRGEMPSMKLWTLASYFRLFPLCWIRTTFPQHNKKLILPGPPLH